MSAGLFTLYWLAIGPAAPPSDVWTMRDRHLQIPIRVNEARRNDLVELVLYVSTDQGRTWTGAGKAKPTQDAFSFHAEKDGLYWFSVQAVDRDGKYDPADIAQAPPALKVMIETQKPLVQIISAERVGEEVNVVWQTLDSQADVNSLRIEYRASDGSSPFWQLAPATPALAGTARFRPNIPGPMTVRLQMSDQSGVTCSATKEIPAAPAVQQANSVAPPATMPVNTPLNQPATGSIAIPPPIMEPPPQPAPAAVAPPPPPASPLIPAAPIVNDNGNTPGNLTPLAGLRNGEEPPRKTAPPPNELLSAPTSPGKTGSSDLQHVRDRQVPVDFEIERKGPSGIKKMETYITNDEGQSWHKWSESGEIASPLQLVLPKDDGVYGFRMVVYSGVMQSDGPPKPGTTPDLRIQVDRLSPQVEWYPPALDANLANALTLRFSVQDAHLDANSISLQWSRQPDTGWQAIPLSNLRPANVPGITTLKECTWLLPADIPDSVYLRLTARDLAGNVGERITRDPVTVDLHKPTARLKRVVTATSASPFRQ